MNHYHQVMIMIVTGFLVLSSNVKSAGSLVYYIFISNLIIEKSQSIEDHVYRFMKNLAAFRNIDDIFHLKIVTNENKKDILDITQITFDHVTLSYGKGNDVFTNKSFTLSKGDAVLLKGENGSGKSSILKMIAGLIPPTSGNIQYNGQSFFDINRKDLYKTICYLNQEELLLNETLEDYLTISSHKSITHTQYENYVSKVNLKPNNETITDNGKKFSGGEKKKAIIMKLLARESDVSVILLDETEAGLDNLSKKVLDSIENELLEHKEKYIIVKITHGEVKHRNEYNKIIDLSQNTREKRNTCDG